jgi:hypothetical protein
LLYGGGDAADGDPVWNFAGVGCDARRGWIGTEGGREDGDQTSQGPEWAGEFQVVLSTLLVVGAGLFLRTLINLNSIDLGFRTDHLLLVDINPPSNQYPRDKVARLHVRLEDALRAVPEVDWVSLSDVPFLADSHSNSAFYLEGIGARVWKRGRDNLGSMEATVGQDFSA